MPGLVHARMHGLLERTGLGPCEPFLDLPCRGETPFECVTHPGGDWFGRAGVRGRLTALFSEEREGLFS